SAAGVAGVAAALHRQALFAQDVTINGIRVGAISYCFRSIPRPATGDYMDTIIKAFVDTGIGLCELESVRVEPPIGTAGGGRMPAQITPEYAKNRDALREWRMSTP